MSELNLWDLLKDMPIVFGCEQLGGHQWGDVNPAEILRTIDVALEHGVRWFDTADVYGMGDSEMRLGKHLKGRRSHAHIISKFGVRRAKDGKIFYDVSRAWLREALEGSLRRLETDYLDLYQMHYWDGITPWEEILEELEVQRAAGKIRGFSFSNVWPSDSSVVSAFDAFSNEFSVLAQENWPRIASYLTDNPHLVFLPYGVLAQGLLSGKYNSASEFGENDRRRSAKYRHFHGDKLKENLEIITRVGKSLQDRKAQAGELCKDVSMASLATAYALRKHERVAPILGIKSQAQLREALASISILGALDFQMNF
jgi:aryl-alcohol dehydrogenase-like predicted oxidoreductase